MKAKVSIIALWQGTDFKVLLPPKEEQLTSLCTQPQAHKWDQFQFRLLNSPDLHHLMTWCFLSHQESPAQVGESFEVALLPILLSFFFFGNFNPVKIWEVVNETYKLVEFSSSSLVRESHFKFFPDINVADMAVYHEFNVSPWWAFISPALSQILHLALSIFFSLFHFLLWLYPQLV